MSKQSTHRRSFADWSKATHAANILKMLSASSNQSANAPGWREATDQCFLFALAAEAIGSIGDAGSSISQE
jgi:hypothetical protein